MITTTLTRIREHGPCPEGWEKLLRGLGKTKADDEPIPFAFIVQNNGLDDALWCVRAEPQNAREWRLFAVWCARQVQHLMLDPRSLAALDVAERHANGLASDKELADAWAAARAAGAAAGAAGDAAGAVGAAAARAAGAAVRAAGDARDARDAALDAAGAVGASAWAAAGDARAARDAALAAQEAKFLEIVS
jgi:hypothetical protein